ncbi:hypothetical protein Ddc_24749 [Ditylenchus destructor]|nr:hypothetical protein Ddc_24749 [Ditylenchus destructor]
MRARRRISRASRMTTSCSAQLGSMAWSQSSSTLPKERRLQQLGVGWPSVSRVSSTPSRQVATPPANICP